MAERIIAMVEEMRANGENLNLWKNVELSRKCFEILESLEDVSALDKALVCETILSFLPEQDVPRYTLGLVCKQLGWLEASSERSEELSLSHVKAHIGQLEDYIDYENVSNEEYMSKYHKSLNFDPIRRTPMWEENICRWEEECEKRLGDAPRGMGFCYGYWYTFAEVLREEGVDWKSPAQMNPRVLFD